MSVMRLCWIFTVVTLVGLHQAMGHQVKEKLRIPIGKSSSAKEKWWSSSSHSQCRPFSMVIVRSKIKCERIIPAGEA